MKLIYLRIKMGGGAPGWVGAFYMSHQNTTKLSSPSGVSHGVTLVQVRPCVCVSTRVHRVFYCVSMIYVYHFCVDFWLSF